MAGIYVHIPFCASRCIYCGFYSTTGTLHHWQDRYVKAVLAELELRKDYLGGEAIKTLYIGGGTPSLLSPDNIRLLAHGLRTMNDKVPSQQAVAIEEFTMECNPDDVTPYLCSVLAEAGINRVSMGVQTFSDDRLRFLRRRHRAEDVPRAVEHLRKAGINNISIDLMFGFPGETIEEWEQDMERGIALDVEHISAYSLMYEEGTPLYTMRERGLITKDDEGHSAEMYDRLLDRLSEAGYVHYEISNFAKQGFRSLHNSCYWNGTKYIGLGAAAHSYDVGSRQWNTSDMAAYVRAIESGEVPMEIEISDARTRYNDMITTALRTTEGIDLGKLNTQEYRYIMKNAHKSINAGTLEVVSGRMRLTRKGLYISDEVMSDLIWV